MFKRLTGTMTDLYWPDTDTSWVDDSGENITALLSFYDEDCDGHRGSDVFPFGLAADEGSGTFRVRIYTSIRDTFSLVRFTDDDLSCGAQRSCVLSFRRMLFFFFHV